MSGEGTQSAVAGAWRMSASSRAQTPPVTVGQIRVGSGPTCNVETTPIEVASASQLLVGVTGELLNSQTRTARTLAGQIRVPFQRPSFLLKNDPRGSPAALP